MFLLPAIAIKEGQRERMLVSFKDKEDREVKEDLSSLKGRTNATEIQKKAKKTWVGLGWGGLWQGQRHTLTESASHMQEGT